MKKLSLLMLLCLSYTAAAQTENAETRGKRVVKEAIAALGGDAFLHMRNRVETGRAYSFYHQKLHGLSIARFYTEYISPQELSPEEAGNKEKLLTLQRESLGKKEDVAVVFRGGDGYELTFHGPKRVPDDQLRKYRDGMFFNILYIFRVRLQEPGLIIESQGSDILENMPLEKVQFTDSEDRVVLVYFHQSTKLPVKEVFYIRDPVTKDRIENVVRFSKYRDVGGGVQWPYDISRERDGERISEMYADKVEINQKLSPDLFTIPAGPK